MNDSERRRSAAYWYAVGRSDATGGPDLSSEFADYARSEADRYYSGEGFFLPSVPQQFVNFMKGR